MIFNKDKLRPTWLAVIAVLVGLAGAGYLFLTVGCGQKDIPVKQADLKVSAQKSAPVPDALGGRQPNDIYQTVMDNIGSLRALYNARKAKSPGLSGKVVLEFVIEPSGGVSSAAIKKSTTGRTDFDKSVADIVKDWQFSARANSGSAKVTYPFAFSP